MKFTKAALPIFGLLLIIGQAYAAEVAVIPSTRILIPGETFITNISIDPQGTAIAGAQLNIAFNSSLIRVNSITEGNLFNRGGAATFFNDGTINNSTGTVINIFNAIIGKNNVSTQGTFIIINATAIGTSGITRVNLSNVKISDPNGNPVGLTVTNGSARLNSPPLLASIGNKIVNEGQTITFTLSASDADGDSLTYLATGLPDGASFNPATRTFQWTPNYTQSGNYSVHFEVSDGIYVDEENIIITVNNVYPRYDVDENGIVDISDMVIIGQHFNDIVITPYPRYDVNMDGVVDVLDITLTAHYFGENT